SAELGLNKPIYTQFWDYVKNIVLHFDLGYSYYSSASVTGLIAGRRSAIRPVTAAEIPDESDRDLGLRHRPDRRPPAGDDLARRRRDRRDPAGRDPGRNRLGDQAADVL